LFFIDFRKSLFGELFGAIRFVVGDLNIYSRVFILHEKNSQFL